MRIRTIPATVKAFRIYDPDSACNQTMLLRLIDEHTIVYDSRNGKIIVDMDSVILVLNHTLGLTTDQIPHLRSIRSAYKEQKKSNESDLGISEAYLRACIKDGRIPSLQIGNRNYIAIESLSEERIGKTIECADPRPRAAVRAKVNLMEQLDAIMKKQRGTPSVRRVRIKRRATE